MRFTSTNELLAHASLNAQKVSDTLTAALSDLRRNKSHTDEGDRLLAGAERASSEVAAMLKASAKEHTNDRPTG